jgi:O-antigen/teichoic acid export membrane protein
MLVFLKKVPNNYFYIFGSTVIMSVISFAIMKTVQARFGQDIFDNYLLILRYTGFLVPLIMLGLGVSMPRYISFIRHQDKLSSNTNNIVDTGIVVISLSVIFTLIFGLSLNALVDIGALFFNGSKYFNLLLVYSSGLALFAYAYAVMRGFEEFKFIELIRVTILGIAGLYFIFTLKNINEYLYAYTTLNIIIFLVVTRYKKIKITKKIDKDVLFFGLKRVVADVSYPLLLSIPIIYTINVIGSSYAAEISFHIMLINIFVLVVNPVSTIMLTKTVTMIGSKIKLYEYIKFVLILSTAVSILFLIISPFIVNIFGYTLHIFDSIILTISVFLLSIFVCLRSIIDAESVKPYLLKITIASLSTEIVSLVFLYYTHNENILLSYFVSITLLCLLAVQRYVEIYKNADNV